jgi:hypothetical protein
MPKNIADVVSKTFKSFIQKSMFEEKEGDVFKLLNLMTPLITTFGMGSTLFNIK